MLSKNTAESLAVRLGGEDCWLEIRRLAAPFGAQILGVDLNQGLSPTSLASIRDAWLEHAVLLFRDQRLSDEALLDFAAALGPLEPPGPNPYGGPLHPHYSDLNVISNIKNAEGRPLGNLGDGEAVWHADMTYREQPPLGAILHAIELPPSGGNTEFASMTAALDALPPDLHQRALGREAIHDASHNSAGILRRGYEPVTDVRKTPGARHPLIYPHPMTGRRALFLGRRPRSYVPSLSVDESDALLDALWAHAVRPQFVYTHRWQLGDVLMWDNLSVLHRRDAFDPTSRRRLHRAQIGVPPIGPGAEREPG
ncbi:MAG: TauD/TfdA family dioxygenase [Pseudomonadota bacterium]